MGPDGRLYAINPENGFFGVAPGTNEKSNPNALATTRKNTIFTNVAHNLDDNTVWWEGLDKNPPENAVDWTGQTRGTARPATEQGRSSEQPLHRSRQVTAPASAPSLRIRQAFRFPLSSSAADELRLAPLVYQSRSWNHGVFVGSIMASETTAAAAGAVGVVRRDPMAMLPFCGYNMADYLAALDRHGRRASTRTRLRRFSTSTGSARTTTATSCGPDSATTCACLSG